MAETTDYFLTISREMFERNREHPEHKHEKNEKSHTPKCVIQSKGIFSSKMDGFGEATPCLEVKTGSERKVVISSSGELDGDGPISVHDVIVCMKYGSWAPKIHAALIEGHKIASIALKRFTTLHQKVMVIQETTFFNCSMKKYSQDSDLIVFAFGFGKVEDTNIHYDDKGQKQGVTSVEFDAVALQIKSKS